MRFFSTPIGFANISAGTSSAFVRSSMLRAAPAEDCKFCAQSARYHTGAEVYPLMSGEEIVGASQDAAESGADRFGIVTSGRGLGSNRGEFERICAAAGEVEQSDSVGACVSIGKLSPADVEQLKAAGIRRVHHNLETSARFYPQICTTRPYQTRLDTIRNIKAAGLEACSGGIFGMGETWEDRVDLALQLRNLGVDSDPINFLNPNRGTPLEGRAMLPPRQALRTIALYRFLLPAKEIRVCGGREVTLRDLQPRMFHAGASGTMIGNYLTTGGRSAEGDRRMLSDLGLTPRSAAR